MNYIQTIISTIYAAFLAIMPISKYAEGVIGQPASFVPSRTKSQHEITVSKLIYRSLFEYDIYGTLQPDLVDTWTMSDEGLVYTVKLKDNQYWTNGKKITSDDLIYTAFNIVDLQGVATDKVDELTVRYTLPNKYAPFINLLTVSVIPNGSLDQKKDLKPVTSDDFRVSYIERSGANIKKIVLTTTKDKYKTKKIVFKYYSNEEELSIASKLGEIDGFSSAQIHEKLEGFENYRFPLQGIYYGLFFNLREEKMQSLELREKLEKVLPIEQFILDKGISVQGPISRGSYTDIELEHANYDPDFKEDLEDLILTITVPDVKRHVELAELVKLHWEEKLEVDVVIRKVDPDKLFEQVIQPRDFEILLFGQEVSRDPDRYVIWHSTQQDSPGLNITGFSHVRADRALEEGRNELNYDARAIHYNEFQKVINEQIPAIFLYHPYRNFYVTKYFKGIGEKYTFTPVDRFLDFYNWERVSTN